MTDRPTFPLCTATRRLVETLNRESKEAWPGRWTHLLETLTLAFNATEILSAFKTAHIVAPSDVTEPNLQVTYDRLRGCYRSDAVTENVGVDWFFYDTIGTLWKSEINRKELIFLTSEIVVLDIPHDTFTSIIREAEIAGAYSLAYVIAAVKRTHDRNRTRRERMIDKMRALASNIVGPSAKKTPTSPDMAAFFLMSFKEGIRDSQIIKENEDRLTKN